MGFSKEWEEVYKNGAHDSIWPWSEVVSLTHRYFRERDKSKLRVLELGCGAGANIPFFASLGAEYCSIEGSPTEVSKLKERYPDNRVIIVQGDFTESLPFEGTFDLILDRGSVTHNATVDIQKTISLAYEKLKEGGFYFGLDWFSTNYPDFTDKDAACEIVDSNTRVFHSGYFSGLGKVHFSDANHILKLFHQMKIMEMYEKVNTYAIPDKGPVSYWSFIAKK